MSQDARADEELATQRRAQILGLTYFDTSRVDNKPIYKELLPKEDLYRLRAVPLQVAPSNLLFGITTTTPQPAMAELTNRFLDQRIAFSIISDTGYRDYMKL